MARKLFALNDRQLKNRLTEMFWDRVKPSDGCWEWQGIKNNRGYGIFIVRGKTYVASRVSFFLYNNRWANGETCHTCDNPGCVNFYHLFEGSHQDNMDDAVSKRKARRKAYAQTFIESGGSAIAQPDC